MPYSGRALCQMCCGVLPLAYLIACDCDLSDAEMKGSETDQRAVHQKLMKLKSAQLAVAAGDFFPFFLPQSQAPSRPCLFVLFDRSSSSACLLFAVVVTAAVSPCP